jgi:hypothetical protein
VERCQSLPRPLEVLLDAILDRIGAVAHLAEMPVHALHEVSWAACIASTGAEALANVLGDAQRGAPTHATSVITAAPRDRTPNIMRAPAPG